jgi:rubrerythrin
MRLSSRFVLFLIVYAITGYLVNQTLCADTANTLANLQTAFNGESNAHARYLAFAERANAEGYAQVASLFRAAARAEEIHAANHAAVIKKLGGTPKADVKKPEVKATAENVKAAVAGESYERDTMYPEFIKEARASKNRDAIRTFNFALAAEAEHAKLYQASLDGLVSLKGSKAKDYFVCKECGYTVAKVDFEKCPTCFNPAGEFYQKVS